MPGVNKSGDGKSLSREQTAIVLSHLRLLLRSRAFARSARAQDFLALVVRNAIKGRYSNLHERMIGAELFGRSIDYDTGSDSVVRVLATEVRKRLNQFYLESSQDEWPVKFELPIGSYVPGFVFANAKLEQPVEPEPVGAPISEPLRQIAPPAEDNQPESLLVVSAEQTASLPKKSLYRLRAWTFPWIIALVLLLMFGADRIFISYRAARVGISAQIAASNKAGAGPNGTASNQTFPAIPLRFIAGYSGPPQRDSAGDIWQADQYSHSGWATRLQNTFIARTSDPLIFRYGRSGGFDYDIPLPPGIYELHLYFVEPSASAQPEEAQNQAVFNVTINGKIVLDYFDIVSDAMGRNVADERVLRDIAPDADGILHLHFSTVIGTPSLSAIQILHGTPHKQLPLHIVTQVNALTDRSGQLWHPDSYYLGGRQLPHLVPDGSASDADPFTTERFGHFSYALPVDSRDQYTVILHFEEFFFGNESSTPGGIGKRIFRVLCNGNTLLDDFDIYKEVGGVHPITKTFHHLKPTAQGKLNLTFEPIKNYATVSAIEVFDESN